MRDTADISIREVGSARATGSGSPEAALVHLATFEAFYLDHAASVGRALELTLESSGLAEDALNEAMTRAFDRWSQLSQYDNPAGWVYRTGLNWARSWLRRRRLERRRVLHGRHESVFADFEPKLAGALESLSVEHRSVVVCRFHLDWSTAETADALGIAEGTVKSRLSRALDQIRTELGVEGKAS